MLPKLSFGPSSEPSVHSVGFISIHFHFFEPFWDVNKKHTHRGINKIQGKEMLNGALQGAVRYQEIHVSPGIHCACVCLCMYKRKEENSRTPGVEASFLAACCVLRRSVCCLSLYSASREAQPVRLLAS